MTKISKYIKVFIFCCLLCGRKQELLFLTCTGYTLTIGDILLQFFFKQIVSKTNARQIHLLEFIILLNRLVEIMIIVTFVPK